jgi:guanosine-3',5'-bis(diphosphate) 3'-pyrophosphohydrolase
MGEIKGQLEDLAFPYVYPQEYADLKKLIKPLVTIGEEYIKKFRRELLSLVRPVVKSAAVSTRRKYLYSLFRKLQRPEINGDISKVHDLFAARIIVNTTAECYEVLGLVHSKFHPVPYLGVSDFIATPKPNGYQSLHTKVFGPDGRIVELQIRTRAMHEQAEMGIAAHWYYSRAKSTGASDRKLEEGIPGPSSKLDWVKQLAAWQQEIKDDDEYLKTLKFDALQHRLLVFSPKGDVYDLPAGSTPVDFAYAVHTDMGSQASGAKVNGKMVSLDYQLRNGDVVEILLDRKRKSPSRGWLDFVVTTTARREIAKSVKSG